MSPSSVVMKLFVEDPDLRVKYISTIAEHNSNADGNYPDAGFDLFVPENMELLTGSLSNKINFRVKVAAYGVKDDGDKYPITLMLYPRSSTGSKTPLRLSNSIGVIDSGYRGDVMGVFDCMASAAGSASSASAGQWKVDKHVRLVQLLTRVESSIHVELVDREEDLGLTSRGSGGFGSTGQ